MTGQALAVTGTGMVTPLGPSAPTSCAAIRCGVNNFAETRYIDGAGRWIVGSAAMLDDAWRGPARLAVMLKSAVEEVLAADPSLDASQVPVLVCVAERDRPGRAENLRQSLAAEMTQHFHFHEDSEFISQGRVGFAVALRQARTLLYERRHPAVIVAGVDSLLISNTLVDFEARSRLLTSLNSDGFVPGEAASAIVVRRPQRRSEPQLFVVGLGFDVEEASIESDKPLRADGMVTAIRSALADGGCDMSAIDFRIADVSGEQYWFKQAALALTRTLRVRKEEFDLWHAADCVGETGAAIGGITLAMAFHAQQNGYARGRNALCHFSNDDGKCAALVLSYQVAELGDE